MDSYVAPPRPNHWFASGDQATEEVTKLELHQVAPHSMVAINEVFHEFAGAEHCYDAFAEVLKNAIDGFVGRKVVTTLNIPRKKWITNTIKTKVVSKRQLYEDMLQGRLEKNAYNTYCQNLRKEINECKKQSHSRNKSTATWAVVTPLQDRIRKQPFHT
ncbi:hypothetical protein QE152_g29645 [Popillia japonica]|uniref:Uncharacterized protein n=1 Tax=Popillia japonica TaxID=7064 RepID=A0AAW1JH40_POPJA